jgi:hypothetical protein
VEVVAKTLAGPSPTAVDTESVKEYCVPGWRLELTKLRPSPE